VLEIIEADQSYFIAEVDNVTKKTFNKQLKKIAPCVVSELGYENHDNFLWSTKIHPKDGFIWKKELVGEDKLLWTRALMYAKAPIWRHPEIRVSPTGWEDSDVNDD